MAFDRIDSDPKRSASHLNLIAHLAGPLAEGARDEPLSLRPDGDVLRASFERFSRQPLLLVGTRIALESAAAHVSVSVALRGDEVPAASTALRFAPFTEAGAFLPAWPTAVLPDGELVPPFDCELRVTGLAEGQNPADVIELRLCEGVLGRVLYIVGAEKARLRRQARELLALRQLRFTFGPEHTSLGNALDRLGSDLGVPRFADRLEWDAQAGQPRSVSDPEPNESYRSRLELFRPFILPARRPIEDLLERAAQGEQLRLSPPNSVFALSILLRSAPTDAPRLNFLTWVREQQLVQPGKPLPATRRVPARVRTQTDALLARLNAGAGASFSFPADALIAPLLAAALDRVGRCRRALGVTRAWKVLRAQDSSGGSRYELGLGVDVELPPATELDLLAENLRQKRFDPAADVETLALLASLQPQPSAADPIGRWLLAGCGLRTVHALPANRYYLSHFPIFGTELTAAAGLHARFHAPGDPGQNVVLWHALRDVAADLAAAQLPPFVELNRQDATKSLNEAGLPSAATTAALEAAGLRTPSTLPELASTKGAIALIPPELVSALALDSALSARVISNAPDAATALRAFIQRLRVREVASVLPLVRGNDLVLWVSSSPLPGVAVALNSRTLDFRWYAIPISGLPGKLMNQLGPRNTFTAPTGSESLSAIVAVSLARTDQADPRDRILPYEVRVELDADRRIDLASFERVMNLLSRAVPVGVVIDTRRLREQHVDPDGSGRAVPMTGKLTHSFRNFQQRRHLGTLPDDRDL